MDVVDGNNIQQPEADESQFVFMRSSFYARANRASIYDVTGGDVRFLGILENNTKIAYEADPGERTFMVVGENADFMEARTVGGKRYYAIATPRMGVLKARFSLWPIKRDAEAEYNTSMSDFQQWRETTQLVRLAPEAKQWYEANKQDIADKYKSYYQKWQKRPKQARERRTLDEDDGL